MEDIMIILGLVIVGLACICAVGYILFRPVVTKDPFDGITQPSDDMAEDALQEDEEFEGETEEAEEAEEEQQEEIDE